MKTGCFLLLVVYLLNIFTTTNSKRIPTLVSTQRLQRYIQKNPNPTRKVRIIETSFNPNATNNYTTEYAQGHIPQAVYYDLNKCVTSTPEIPRNLPELKCITDYMQSLGVWPDTYVVVYARFSVVQAFRTWWIFRLFGHKLVSVLDGGLQKWIADGYKTSTSIPLVDRSAFEGKLDRSLFRSFEDMVANAVTNKEQVIDARPPNSPWVSGKTSESGVIPGAKMVTFTTLLNADETMKNKPKIKTIFEDNGVNLTLPMVTYCNSGMTATVIAGAAHVLGLDIPIYYGSWNEWSRRAPENLKQRVIA
ncbi:thiosulfate sulfurtransferase-like [Mercenaria mercenaria]|uniref:thiosulfate sulfurtransferase-like n=1 Tax=Mercenaria mercenaria TaxID=6596 RepID=UPI00234E49BA|nr:thiosulfate sulfurtransferase-like [Mercenaria mercenaria]